MSGSRINNVAVVGAGLVGSAWTIIFSLAGLHVRVFDADAGVRGKVAERVRSGLADMEKAGLASGIDAAFARVSIAETLPDAVGSADFIQESAFETVPVKTAISQEIGAAMRADAICASSSSGIPASAFTAEVKNRSRFLIAHPVNPPHLVPIVELVPAPWTHADVVPTTRALMERIGQAPISVAREIEGFVLNRLQGALLTEAFALFEEGYASAADIDTTISQGLGLRWAFMGPFETIDLNAPGGVADYARRFGPLYARIAASRTNPRGWSEALVDKVAAERRTAVPAEKLAERRDWRDRRLMALAAHLRKAKD